MLVMPSLMVTSSADHLRGQLPVYEANLDALVADPARRDEITHVARRINQEIETYFGIRIVIGVDAAAFRAVIVFVFSFILTIGSLVGIVFPSLMALVQFEMFGPLLIVLPMLAAFQLADS